MNEQSRRRRTLPFWERQMTGPRVRAALEKMGISDDSFEQFQKAYRATRKNRWVANRELAGEVERLRAELETVRGK